VSELEWSSSVLEIVATGGHCSELQWQTVAGQLDHRERLQLGWSGHKIVMRYCTARTLSQKYATASIED